MMDRRKRELENVTEIAFSTINNSYQAYLNGSLSEEDARLEAIEALKKIRYDNNIGYFWINDIRQPYPTMIMHPTIPDLDGQILDHESFFVTKDANENLFVKPPVELINGSPEGQIEGLSVLLLVALFRYGIEGSQP